MSIDSSNAFVCTGFEQFASDELLDCEDDAIFASYTNRGASILYCLDCILDLEVSAIRGEHGVCEIVACTYGRLCCLVSKVISEVVEMRVAWDYCFGGLP